MAFELLVLGSSDIDDVQVKYTTGSEGLPGFELLPGHKLSWPSTSVLDYADFFDGMTIATKIRPSELLNNGQEAFIFSFCNKLGKCASGHDVLVNYFESF